MYLSSFGGSGLLHLLAAHPRVVAVVGIAATVSMLNSPLGPGRFLGTADYLATVERSFTRNELVTAARRATAERNASAILEQADDEAITTAVSEVLAECGSGCTDVSTGAVVSDTTVLRRVLVLHELDREVARAAAAERHASQSPRSGVLWGE